MKNIFIISVILFSLSCVFTFLIRYYLLRHKIVDIPNERSSHTIPTPRGGGMAIVFIWYLGISYLFYIKIIEQNLYFALLSGFILAVVSLLDDLFNLKPFIRLSAQILTAILSFIFLKGIDPVAVSGIEITSKLLLYPVVIFGMVWFINLFNFLDGIDGYASLETIMVSLALYLLTANPICLILIVVVLGFLYWNWPKAKIFMGDVGSTQLGFILVVLGVYFHNEAKISIFNWIMLSSLFWFDATLTLYRRWRNHENITIAHKKHAYQRAVQAGLSHQQTIVISIIINIVIIGLVFLSRTSEILLIPLFVINILFLYGITKLIDKKIPFRKE